MWTHALLGSYLALMVLAVAWLHRDLLLTAAAATLGGAWPAAAAASPQVSQVRLY